MFNDFRHIIEGWGIPILVIIAVLLIKVAWSKTKCHWRDWVRQATVSLFVGMLANNYMMDHGGYKRGTILAVVAFSAFQADSLVQALTKIGDRMQNDPIKFAKEIRDLLRGK